MEVVAADEVAVAAAEVRDMEVGDMIAMLMVMVMEGTDGEYGRHSLCLLR